MANALAVAFPWGCRLTIHGLALVLAKVVSLETEGPTLEWVPTEIRLSSETRVAVFGIGVPFEISLLLLVVIRSPAAVTWIAVTLPLVAGTEPPVVVVG